ncbi:MAG: hypothetical protein ABSB41_19910 [Anaerolineales bacterium]|jgi:hypothetical protein
MNQPVKKMFEILKNKIREILQIIRNPGRSLAMLILRVYKGEKDKIPLLLLTFIIRYLGPWLGIGIYMPIRQYQEALKRKKLRKLIDDYFLPLLILVIVIIGAFQRNDNFFFGFFQNLAADIILIILAIYILPKQLNKPQKYNVTLDQSIPYDINHVEGKTKLMISIINTGDEIYKKEEINWEIFISSEYLIESDITLINGDYEISEEFYRPMWKFYGINKSPLFLDQKFPLVSLIFDLKTLEKSSVIPDIPYMTVIPPKIYYILRTINGNIPTIENISRDFQGDGIPFERYPKIGELIIKYPHNFPHSSEQS